MNIDNLFDEKLAQYLDHYCDVQDSVGSKLKQSFKNSKDAEIIIPVLGMQGMGKSTLINGLLEENILPNDADETTCVPVEIKYGETECAKVHFFDSSKIIVVNTREELNEFVDNNYNQANEKHVANIELFRKNDLLKNGMVIVDLPGVGSLTRENENTTKRYVENLCSAIFVIPTVPTIRNKEAVFIKSLWSQFSKAIFVQNDWGETKKELAESLDFNKKVLRNIAEELHNPYDNEIIVVNAYNAVAGSLQKNRKLVAESNIKSLFDKIVLIAKNWDSDRENILKSRILLCIEYAKQIIQKRLSDISKSKETIEKENKEKLNEFHKCSIEISEKVESLKRYLHEQENEIYQISKSKSSDCAKKIRAAIYRVIDGGVYDGDHLSSAFSDIQDDEIKDFTNDILDIFMQIKFKVEDKFSEIQEIEIENRLDVLSDSINLQNKIKWEKGVQVLANVGGAVAGATLAAPLLAACGVTGPAGWIVAGVGLAIYGVISFFGWGVKKIKQSDRADKAKRELNPHIENIESSLAKAITEKYNDYMTSCIDLLDRIITDRVEEEKRFKESLSKTTASSEEPTLKADLEYLSTMQNRFENV